MPRTRETLDMIWRYVNSEIWLALFLLSVTYFFIIAKKRQKWAIAVSIVSLMLFINDYVLVFVERTMGEGQRYYRYLWIIPFVFFIVTAMVDAFRRWKHIIPRVLLLIGSGVVAVLLFQNSGLRYMSVPNIDLIPAGLSEISDALDTAREEKGKELFVACPDNLHDYLEMYNGKIKCGHESEIIAIDQENGKSFSAKEPEVEYIMSACCSKGYDYVLICKNGKSRKTFKKAGFLPKKETEQYLLYECSGYEGYIQDITKRGQLSWKAYIDAEGNPRITDDGYAIVRYEYDNQGRLTAESYFDTNGQSCLNNKGYASVIHEYDDRGRDIETNYVDIEKHPVLRDDRAYFSVKSEWNGHNKLVNETYYGTSYELVVRKDLGYSSRSLSYDDNDRMIKETYYDGNGNPVIWAGRYAEEKRTYDENGKILSRDFCDIDGELLSIDGINLSYGVSYTDDGWTEWIIPAIDKVNDCYHIGYANLCEKQAGDIYACQLEIEFSGVSGIEGKDFWLRAQGIADDSWEIGNVWNDSLVSLRESPRDGIYHFSSTCEINDRMADISVFDLELRCDYWGSGMFRVRRVKVEKGTEMTPWTP